MSKLAALLKAKGITASHASGTARHYLDTNYPPLNQIVSGDPLKGLPSGQLAMIAGPSACGKTMIATSLMISAQKMGGFAAFFDYETQYQIELATQQGLEVGNDDSFFYQKPDTFEEGILAAIEMGKMIRENKIIEPDKPIVMVFDSLHAMTPKSKYDSLFNGKDGLAKKGEGRLSMHDNYALASASSGWFPVIQREFDKYGITGIFLNQVRIQTGPTGAIKYTFPGGDAVYYYCSTIIILTARNKVEGEGDTKKLLYKDIKAYTEKSRNTAPFQNVHYNFVFNEDKTGDFDVIGSYAEHLRKIGAIVSKGSRVEWSGGSPYLSQVITELKAKNDGLDILKKLHADFLAKAE